MKEQGAWKQVVVIGRKSVRLKLVEKQKALAGAIFLLYSLNYG
jgi:hypothetical protein